MSRYPSSRARPLLRPKRSFLLFFLNNTATTEIYTLSLHDALPISLRRAHRGLREHRKRAPDLRRAVARRQEDRKSTRLNSSHSQISYAVFCLKKKKLNSFVLLLDGVLGPQFLRPPICYARAHLSAH